MSHQKKEIPGSFGLRRLSRLMPPPVAGSYDYFTQCTDFPFEQEARTHSTVNAWWLADCALLVYEEEPVVKKMLAKTGRFDMASFQWLDPACDPDNASTTGFMVEADDMMWVVFRGTEFYRFTDLMRKPGRNRAVVKDIYTDFQLALSPQDAPPLGFLEPVHAGFFKALNSVWKALSTRLASTQKPLWLSGHSLGGALAVLTAYQFSEKVAGVYTFGAPCVGGRDFIEACEKNSLAEKTYRYVHGNDLVAKGLEIAGGKLGLPDYLHFGEYVFIDPGNRKNFIERLYNRLLPLDQSDHAPLYYALHTWNRMIEADHPQK